MKAMVCEMCGGNEILKRDGVYVCQHCGTKYDTDEARKLLVGGTVSVQGIATTDNLMDRAQEFLDRGDTNRALEYIDRVLDIDIRNERAREMQRTIEGRKITNAISRLQRSKASTQHSEVPRLGNVTVSEQKYQEIVGMLRGGQREAAITVVKAETGWGLEEAGEYVDGVLLPSLGLPVSGEVTRSAVVVKSSEVPSSKSKGLALVLCLLFGWCGAHCFYVGKVGTGVLYAFTMGFFLFGWFLDLYLILTGNYRDKSGLRLV